MQDKTGSRKAVRRRSSLYGFLFFMAGTLLLSALSLPQKVILGASITDPYGYLMPFVFGGVSGLAIGLAFLRLREHARILGDMVRFSRDITTTTDLRELYRKVTGNARDLLGLDYSTLMTLSEDKTCLIICDTIGFPEQMMGTFSLVPGQGLSTFVIGKKAADAVEDFRRETRFLVPAVVTERGITSAISAPMMIGDEVFGVLIGHTTEKRRFNRNDLALCQGIANQAAIAIKNACHLAALQESEKKYRDLYDHAPDMYHFLDDKGIIIDCNETEARMLGYRKEEIIGRPITDFFTPESCEAFEREFPSIRDGKSLPNIGNLERWFVRKDGSVFPTSLNVLVELGRDGRFVRSRAIARDITALKEAEQRIREYAETLQEKVRERTAELLEAKELAEAANKSKSDFLANMSHELRTPLNAILGFTEMVVSGMAGSLNEKQEEYLRDVYESGQILLSLIDDILDLSKIESGKMDLLVQQINVRRLFQESLALFREQALRRSHSLTVEVNEDVGTVEADGRRLRQVIVNLLSNAVKFTPDGGAVRVRARLVQCSEFGVRRNEEDAERRTGHAGLDRDFMEISVEDTGIGIKAEDMSRLFRPFEQLEPPYEKNYKGTGLGLALCRRIVDLHGGQIWAESEFGKGSRFAFTIPVRSPVGTGGEA